MNERETDIPLLADHFMASFAKAEGRPVKTLDNGAYEALKKTNWTGNIRELRNIIERLNILCDDPITGEDVRKYANPGE